MMLTIALIITGIVVYTVIASIAYAVADAHASVDDIAALIALFWPICAPVWLLCLAALAMVPMWRAIGMSTVNAFGAWRKRKQFPRATARQRGAR
jgi:hypothetical protein